MKEIKNVILSRKNQVIVPVAAENAEPASAGLVAAFCANVASLGYCCNAELLERLRSLSAKELLEVHDWLIPALQAEVGYARHQPMYPNFPQQVAEASEAELWFNAIAHYIGSAIGCRIMPDATQVRRPALLQEWETTALGLAPENVVEALFVSLLGSKATPSVGDREDLKLLIEMNVPLAGEAAIPCKETLAYVVKTALACKSPLLETFQKQLKTATDVLRLLATSQTLDPRTCKIVKVGRAERRFYLGLLNGMKQNFVQEDMGRRPDLFKRLGEMLHPGEHAKACPAIAESFRMLRNEGCRTFNGRFDKAVKSGDHAKGLALLAGRPGELVRRFDSLLRSFPEPAQVIAKFDEVASDAAATVLWQAYGHFRGRDQIADLPRRICFPKGNLAKPLAFNTPLTDLNGYGEAALSSLHGALAKKYASLPKLGKVYLDPACDNLLMPFGNRSASGAKRQAGRGSRFPLEGSANTVRLFMYWSDFPEECGYHQKRVDLDLSALLFDENWRFIDHCSFSSLRYVNENDDPAMLHSGDIVSAPDGASEFIDINLDRLDPNVAYVVTKVTCFTGQPMSALEEGFMGWMTRERPNSGEIYEPQTVTGRIDLRSAATDISPVILDVRRREIVWADATINETGACWSVRSTLNESQLTGEAIVGLKVTTPSLGDLFRLHVEARGGELVASREGADLVIAEDGDLSPFDTARVMSEFA